MSSSRAKDPYDQRDIPISSKHKECAINVRSFSNLVDFKVSCLPDNFMPTSNC